MPSAIFFRSTTILVSEPTVIGGMGRRKRSLAGSPNGVLLRLADDQVLRDGGGGRETHHPPVRAGWTPEPQAKTLTVSLRDQSMSLSEASSMADLPVVPLEQET